jgi:hypothetical protein
LGANVPVPRSPRIAEGEGGEALPARPAGRGARGPRPRQEPRPTWAKPCATFGLWAPSGNGHGEIGTPRSLLCSDAVTARVSIRSSAFGHRFGRAPPGIDSVERLRASIRSSAQQDSVGCWWEKPPDAWQPDPVACCRDGVRLKVGPRLGECCWGRSRLELGGKSRRGVGEDEVR